MLDRRQAIVGAMLGCAVGDALGLPYEGLSRRRGAKLLGTPDRYRFLGNRGMVSDDTQHTWMVAESLCLHPDDEGAFSRALAQRLRWWLASAPAGIGFATLRAVLKLCVGFPPDRSGVFSAGNGPAMRVAILGAAVDDLSKLHRFVWATTRITHTDPKAFEGAMGVAVAAWCARRKLASFESFMSQFTTAVEARASSDFLALLAEIRIALAEELSVDAFASSMRLEKGVSGYVYHTVPVVLYAWLRHPDDVEAVVTSLVRCGGDTDTTAAIGGAIAGSGTGEDGIPRAWVEGLWEWPRSVSWTRELADTLDRVVETSTPERPPSVIPLATAARSLVFTTAVLAHGLRRLLPPY